MVNIALEKIGFCYLAWEDPPSSILLPGLRHSSLLLHFSASENSPSSMLLPQRICFIELALLHVVTSENSLLSMSYLASVNSHSSMLLPGLRISPSSMLLPGSDISPSSSNLLPQKTLTPPCCYLRELSLINVLPCSVNSPSSMLLPGLSELSLIHVT